MLAIHNAFKTFNAQTPEEVQALRGVDLEVGDGDFLSVIGSNGSGKSTLLGALAGAFLLDAGRIDIDGVDVTRWPDYRRAALIGRVFQNPFQGTAPKMSIAENFALAALRGHRRGLRWAIPGRLRREIQERVSVLRMGLEDRLDEAIGSLSGGQRQALTLLMATWLRPKLLLLDEHTAALDPKSAAKVAELTKQIIDQEKLTALMVTHSMQQAVDLPDRIVMMHRGQIVEDYRADMKRRVRIPDLIAAFDRVQKRELFDESVANLLAEQYR